MSNIILLDPTWVTIAKSLIGTKEVPGPKSNPTIMNWVKSIGSKVLGIAVNDDATAWCGTFAANVITQAGFTPPKIAIRASSWDGFGVPVAKPFLGAIARFERKGGGHVGFIVGVSADGKLLRVLGGNQGDCVSETWIERSRCVAYRWPSGIALPNILAPVLTAVGGVSKNES